MALDVSSHVNVNDPKSTTLVAVNWVALKVTTPISLESHVAPCRSTGYVHTPSVMAMSSDNVGYFTRAHCIGGNPSRGQSTVFTVLQHQKK